ncbi:hypothetical protein AB1Y20_023562 [Prymnesium parvum]|uniref:Ribosomal biogenesis protein LAS1L n=1 Tax=Prymnesium parvum TaxID=97485 RepID=A0AB34JH30_PRYPA
MARVALTPWASWAEWEETYAALFALDDPARRAAGVRSVERWRSRARLPVAVDSTASLTEVGLADTPPHAAAHTPPHAAAAAADGGAAPPSEHALCLMYAMTIVRLVNGVVDPMQQGHRAASVQALARELELPAALVELRHECTHNRLPSLSTFRLVAEQALLWLHERYWQPQRALLRERPRAVGLCLARYREASLPRCAGGANPPKHELAAAVAELEGGLNPLELRSLLLAKLLDDGFLAPSGAPRTPVDEDGAADDDERAWGAELQGRLWLSLLRCKPALPVGSALLLECVKRIVAEAPLAAAAAANHWGLRVLSQPAGDASLSLDAPSLRQAAWLALKAASGWGRPLVEKAVERADFPDELRPSVRALLALGASAGQVRHAEAKEGERGGACVTPAEWAAALDRLPGLEAASQPLAAGAAWSRCTRWAPVAIGEAPPRAPRVTAILSAGSGDGAAEGAARMEHGAVGVGEDANALLGEAAPTSTATATSLTPAQCSSNEQHLCGRRQYQLRLLLPPASRALPALHGEPIPEKRPVKSSAKRRRGAAEPS